MYFWIESVVIGLFYIIKSITYRTKGYLFSYIFTFFFYLLIHLMLLFLIVQFGINGGQGFDYTYLIQLLRDSYILEWKSITLPVLLIYSYDFIYNFLPRKERLKEEGFDPISHLNGRSIVFIFVSFIFPVLVSILNSAWVVVLITVLIRILYEIDAKIKKVETQPKVISINVVAGFIVNLFLLMFTLMFTVALLNNPRPIDLIASAGMFGFILFFKRIVK